jgi:uncharacterized membrane protein YphA (DoxX/SURF4 family)
MPGVGLLLLRTAIGLIAAAQGAGLIASAGSVWQESGVGLPAILVGAALIAGLLTPCAAALVAIGAVLSVTRAAEPSVTHGLAHGLILIDALSLVLLGPGAYSIDARLFGRREIHIRESYRGPRE